MSSDRYIGLMSGTSLDGIDAVLADFSASASVVSTHYATMPDSLRAKLSHLLRPDADELGRSALAANELTQLYAEAVTCLLDASGYAPRQVAAIGCHGQTVRHRPDLGYTIQLVNGALLAEQTGIPVVCDFRSRDVAAGGQGAPLVPAFHAAVFHSTSVNRAVVNLGGIANVTWLPCREPLRGFDCGPGNVLLDQWAESHLGQRYDAGGRWAAGGRVLPALLDALLADPFFARRGPRSTGREHFSLEWARAYLREEYRPQDVQATFAELSAKALAAAIDAECEACEEVLLCGGGVANCDLVERIGRSLPRRAVMSTACLGLDPDWVEAVAFAWLARETLAGRPGNVPGVTGAHGARVLGCVYPA
jgi:anhydro-N-acetylmuramic acid kinase